MTAPTQGRGRGLVKRSFSKIGTGSPDSGEFSKASRGSGMLWGLSFKTAYQSCFPPHPANRSRIIIEAKDIGRIPSALAAFGGLFK